LDTHVRQIKAKHEVERHIEIRIIISDQYMTSLSNIQSKPRNCLFYWKTVSRIWNWSY